MRDKDELPERGDCLVVSEIIKLGQSLERQVVKVKTVKVERPGMGKATTERD